MKRTSLFYALALIAGFVFPACHHESSLTGPALGSGTLSGQVMTVGDLAGSSAAAINVSYSGQVATTDTQGRFMFTGLSSQGQYSAMSTGGQMSFSRADGIHASAALTAGTSAVVVQLQKTQATILVTGQAKQEIEGVITAVSSSSITVNDASTHGPVESAITSSTVIRKGNLTLSASSLNIGEQVHVTSSIGSDGSLTATEIIVQDDGSGSGSGGGQVSELEGLILKVSTSSITVDNASTGGPVTAAITSSTVIRKGNTAVPASALNVGDRVHVKTTGSADALTATEIIVQ